MPSVFVIEDEIHAEQSGEYSSIDDALNELYRRKKIPWDQPPNQCPCTSWRTCERDYWIVEYTSSQEPWEVLSRTSVMQLSAKGVVWNLDN